MAGIRSRINRAGNPIEACVFGDSQLAEKERTLKRGPETKARGASGAAAEALYEHRRCERHRMRLRCYGARVPSGSRPCARREAKCHHAENNAMRKRCPF